MTTEVTTGQMDTVNATLQNRLSKYGDFAAGPAKVSMAIKRAMRAGPNWDRLDDDMAEALDMVANKIGRIIGGDPTYADSWHDIAGYARLVENRLVGRV